VKLTGHADLPRRATMAQSRFLYVTYIRTTPEKLWDALTRNEFIREYWCETRQESEWKLGASWKAYAPDGRLIDTGEVLEIEPPHKLVFSWRNELFPEAKAEGYSRATYLLEPLGDTVKLTVIHEMDKPDSKLIAGVSDGWPSILASLKSMLETGQPLEVSRHWPKEKAAEKA
jgi:uncharacterized protein YndB with AHSA1/START domain